jgi:hypothetical protein
MEESGHMAVSKQPMLLEVVRHRILGPGMVSIGQREITR